jgi:protein-tyrosine phosphatase
VIAPGVQHLNRLFVDNGVEVEVVAGAEVALSKLAELDDSTIRALCLGDGPYLLVESPYTYAPVLLERLLSELQERGLRPILAHPERSASFLEDPPRLRRLVDGNILCSVTAASMAGTFGGAIRRFTLQLFREGLVHDVASDAHDPTHRSPNLRHGFDRLEQELPGIADQAEWFTVEAPAAILAGRDLPPRPAPLTSARTGWRRLFPRRRSPVAA